MNFYCFFCSRNTQYWCSDCTKHLCSYCKQLDHCNIYCNQSLGADQPNSLYTLNHLCGSCLTDRLSPPITLIWETSSVEEIEEIRYKADLYIRSSYVLKMIGKINHPEVMYADFKKDIWYVIGKLANKRNRNFLIVSSAFSIEIYELLISLVNTYGIKISVSNMDFSLMANLIPFKRHLSPSDRLMSQMEIQSNTGNILLQAKNLKIRDIPNDLIRKREFLFENNQIELVSIIKNTFDHDAMSWAIRALERRGIIPFVDRIQDVLEYVYNLIVPVDLIWDSREIIKHLNCQEVVDLRNVSRMAFSYEALDDAEVNEELEKKKTLFMSIPYRIHEIEGTFLKSVLYSYVPQFPAGLRVRDVYHIIELIKSEENQKEEEPNFSIEKVASVLKDMLKQQSQVSIQEVQNIFPGNIEQIVKYIDISHEFLLAGNSVQLNEDKECPICLEILINNGYILGCGHYFHQNCLRKIFLKWNRENSEIRCPSCMIERPPDEVNDVLIIRHS